jgi:hypothetical protein
MRDRRKERPTHPRPSVELARRGARHSHGQLPRPRQKRTAARQTEASLRGERVLLLRLVGWRSGSAEKAESPCTFTLRCPRSTLYDSFAGPRCGQQGGPPNGCEPCGGPNSQHHASGVQANGTFAHTRLAGQFKYARPSRRAARPRGRRGSPRRFPCSNGRRSRPCVGFRSSAFGPLSRLPRSLGAYGLLAFALFASSPALGRP